MNNASSSNDDTHKYCDEGGGGGASSKEMCTSCEQNKNVSSSGSSANIDAAVVVGIDGITMSDTKLSVCANCGKKGSDMNICNRCNSVKYCNAACKKKHRSKHKKKCDRRVAELHDEALFKQPPTLEDCPICMIRLPEMEGGRKYYTCCGKIICSGCSHANMKRSKGQILCPFCRTPEPTSNKEELKRNIKRVEMKDFYAMYEYGCCFDRGKLGCPQNLVKALEQFHRAGELGCAEAHNKIGYAYYYGKGVQRDMKKAAYYWEISAVNGDAKARHNLGAEEKDAGNMERALKHFMIAVECGISASLDTIKRLYMNGHATKEDYAKALQAYQSYLDEIRSDQRDDAAAHDSNQYKYY